MPPEVREGEAELESNLPCIGSYEAPAVSVLQGREEERFRVYRSRIREAFAHRGSVLFIVPSAAHISQAVELLSHGIENRIVTLTPQQTKKKRLEAMTEFHDLSRAKLIIATPSYSFLDRHDLTLIIVENSRSPYYKGRTRPYFDHRDVVKLMARTTGRALLFGDLLPRAEEEYLRREDIYLTESENPKRIAFDNKVEIITETAKERSASAFTLLSAKLLEAIVETSKARKPTLLYAARRGIAPLVMCHDCGHIFRCPDSGAPYSLLKTLKNGEERRWFVSSTSGRRVPAADVCPECGSWRLKERGVGIQQVYDELRSSLPEYPLFLFDHTTATTHRKACQIVGDFYEAEGGILLATSKVLPYLDTPVALSAITSLEAARAIPSWRADEELFSLLLQLRERTSERCVIQSRSEPDELLTYAKQGLVSQFYDDELSLRNTLNYPPFATFVHLTMQGSPAALDILEASLAERLGAWKPSFYPSAGSSTEKPIRHGLIRIQKSVWPDQALIANLATLPPQIRIEIDPPRIV
ncbi:hypothetical protein H6783_03565 [Candidatus Nomurabacteria bacterium]|nr:hypothetical protein [Candidatus Nomurabacteria bacterium]